MKKLAGKVKEWLRDKDESDTINDLDMMAFILSHAIIIVMIMTYALLIGIFDYFDLGFSRLIIGTIVTTIIVTIIYIMSVIQFIKSFVWEYDDIQDLKFLGDCADRIDGYVIKEWIKIDITDRQNQLEALQHTKHKSKEGTSLDKTLKKRKSQFDAAKRLLNDVNYTELDLPKKAYKKVLSNVDKLAVMLDNDESSYAFVETTFNVYADEFVTILRTMAAAGNLSEESRIKVKELIKAFNSYVVRTIDKIQNHNQMNIDISCDVIMKNLNNTNI